MTLKLVVLTLVLLEHIHEKKNFTLIKLIFKKLY